MSVGGARGALVLDAGGAQPRCSGALRRGAERVCLEAGCALVPASTRLLLFLPQIGEWHRAGIDTSSTACGTMELSKSLQTQR